MFILWNVNKDFVVLLFRENKYSYYDDYKLFYEDRSEWLIL